MEDMGRGNIKKTLRALALLPAEQTRLKKDITNFWRSKLPTTDTTRVSKAVILSVAQAFIDQKGAMYFSTNTRTTQENVLHSIAAIIESQRRNYYDNLSRRKGKRRAMSQTPRPRRDSLEARTVPDSASWDWCKILIRVNRNLRYSITDTTLVSLPETENRIAHSTTDGSYLPSDGEPSDEQIGIIYRARREHSAVPEIIGSDDVEEVEGKEENTAVNFEFLGRRWEFKSLEAMTKALATFILKLSGQAKRYRESSDRKGFGEPEISKDTILDDFYALEVFQNIGDELQSYRAGMNQNNAPDEDSSPTEMTFQNTTWTFNSLDHKAASLKGALERVTREIKSHLGDLDEGDLPYKAVKCHTNQYSGWLKGAFLSNGAKLLPC
ncbi:hypothetical protein AYL99_01434 [Fonsecaea erecta]|uniref:Uncharacterized protein n=1 Tax=Fonsecaea erecta TaxID=1367422 RepID=A0A179A0E6_9EURO|nr:hypothetical protein AYL99_01434 [Fonsecaea erecta]OAP65462.1 hypothetical protein AYL99_01434 [Fonsecaea erecta]